MARFSTRQIAVTGLLGALTIAMGLLPVGGFIPVPTPAGNATTMHIPTIIAGILEGPVVGGLVGLIFGVFSFWRAQTQANPVAKSLFSDPLVAFVPRVLIGVVAHYVFVIATGESSRKLASSLVGLAAGYTTYSALAHVNTLQAKALAAGTEPGWLVARLSPFTAFSTLIAGIAAIVGCVAAIGAYRLQKRQHSAPALASLLATAVNTAGVLSLAVMRGYMTAPVAIGIAVLHGLPEMLTATVLVVLIYRGLSHTNLIKKSPYGPNGH